MNIILTSTQNQKDNEDKNNITMNLGECENIIKDKYNISKNSSLYMIQIISEEEGMKIPKVEYEVYYPLYNSNDLKKLDLSFCKGSKVEISIAVKINEPLDKYNLSSGYYNDICSKTTSDSGTDIPLNDRRNEFVDNNMALCEENCQLIEYNYAKEKAKCSCEVKTSVPPNFDIKFNKNDFFKSFADVKNIFNVKIMKCYGIVLIIKSLKRNIGFYIIASIILFYFITLLIFTTSSFEKLKEEINKILLAIKFNENPIKNDQIINEQIIIINIQKSEVKKKTEKKEKEEKIISNKNDKKERNKKENNKKERNKKENNKKENNKKERNKKENNKKESNKKKDKKLKLNNCSQKCNNHSKKSKKNDEINSNYKINVMESMNIQKSHNKLIHDKEILKRKEFELSSLSYKEAIKFDQRDYCQYYISSLKYNHPILFSFGSYDDYNSKIIKIFLFFFSFSLDFTINALFFTDETMHKIYQDKGEFDFLYQIPQILYSTIISKIIDALIKNFSLTQDNFVCLKQKRKIKKIERKRKKLFFAFKIKFILFFALTFIFLMFCWYYITCFCGIYSNTQTHLFKDSLISVITSQLIPFVLYLIPGIFRITALKAEKPTKRCMYKFSLFLDTCLG